MHIHLLPTRCKQALFYFFIPHLIFFFVFHIISTNIFPSFLHLCLTNKCYHITSCLVLQFSGFTYRVSSASQKALTLPSFTMSPMHLRRSPDIGPNFAPACLSSTSGILPVCCEHAWITWCGKCTRFIAVFNLYYNSISHWSTLSMTSWVNPLSSSSQVRGEMINTLRFNSVFTRNNLTHLSISCFLFLWEQCYQYYWNGILFLIYIYIYLCLSLYLSHSLYM